MLKRFMRIMLAAVFVYVSLPAEHRPKLSIIPQPEKIELGKVGILRKESFGHPFGRSFRITPKTKIAYFKANEEMRFAAEYLAAQLRTVTGYKLELMDATTLPKSNYIFLNYIREEELGTEGYAVEVLPGCIDLEANNARGFFYAVQTLFQLLPTEVYSRRLQPKVKWIVPAAYVVDKPRFAWRGMHLDVSRHFFPKEFLFTYIDMLAMHKMNVFHWHLTDDQGWRLEIKKYPKLTETAAWRVDRENQHWNFRDPPKEGEKATYGGFYTQDDVRAIVKYAAERNITVVPEIEMPAHATAVLAAYPQFSCTGGPFKVPPGGVWPITDIFCAGNDSTFDFLQDVLSEVVDLFPSKFIHVGGDEADKKEWKRCGKCQARIKSEGLRDEGELQSYFIKRIEKFLVSKGRRLVGWDEILEGGLAPEATVMSWRGTEGGIAAAQQNHDVVMTPGTHCYFDFYQGREEFEPLAIGGYTPLSKVYAYEPVPDQLTTEQAKHILGAQANVWSEYIPTPEHAQYMTMPRMAAMAEALWSSQEARNWIDFARRIEQQFKRYESRQYKYAKSAYQTSFVSRIDSATRRATVELVSEMPSAVIRYTLDGNKPSLRSKKYTQPLVLKKSTTVCAITEVAGKRMSEVAEQKVLLHKAAYKSIVLKQPFEHYNGGGPNALINGLRGSKSYDDGNWQGYHQYNLEATIDLGKVETISSIATSFLENTRAWIFLPTHVEFSVAMDSTSFNVVGSFDNSIPTANREPSVQEVRKSFSKTRARFIRVKAASVGTCPDWHIGKGDKAWLFVDEIVVE